MHYQNITWKKMSLNITLLYVDDFIKPSNIFEGLYTEWSLNSHFVFAIASLDQI